MAEGDDIPNPSALLAGEIRALVDDFENMGFDRGQIGVVMASIALGIVQVHFSPADALRLVDELRELMQADAAVKQ